MIYGIGVDLVESKRFIKILDDSSIMRKLFTDREIKFINNNYILAADNFASKEAIVKSISTGFKGIDPRDIEILRKENGAPVINLFGSALEFFSSLNLKLFLSISNTKEFSIAYVVCEEE